MNDVAAGPTDLEIALQIVGESSKMLDGVCYLCVTFLLGGREGEGRCSQIRIFFLCKDRLESGLRRWFHG